MKSHIYVEAQYESMDTCRIWEHESIIEKAILKMKDRLRHVKERATIPH